MYFSFYPPFGGCVIFSYSFILCILSLYYYMHSFNKTTFFFLQGTPGEKGQKGDLGQPAIDVFQAVKVVFHAIISFPQTDLLLLSFILTILFVVFVDFHPPIISFTDEHFNNNNHKIIILNMAKESGGRR